MKDLRSRELKHFRREMVEAAGVEPASENASSQTTTCVSPFSCRSRLETEPKAPAAIPDMSQCHASGRNVAPSLLNDDQSRAVGTLKLIAHWLLSSEGVVCIRSYVVFPRDLRGAWASARVPRSRTPVEARSPPRGETPQSHFQSTPAVTKCQTAAARPTLTSPFDRRIGEDIQRIRNGGANGRSAGVISRASSTAG
jgi:hypothetical protein